MQVHDVHKRYGEHIALAGVSMHVERGETVVVMGPSGCGKSTLLHCINRLTVPDAGDVLFDGQSVTAMNEAEVRALRGRIGFVFQNFHLIRRLNVLDNVQLGLVLRGMDKEAATARAVDALRQVQLLNERKRLPGQLSGGQQQRVAIARAIAASPHLMLWDEPTAALDPVLVGEVLDIMEQLAATRQTGMLVVTHEVRFARKAADRVVLMDNGAIVEQGSPEQIFGAPRSDIGRRYSRLLAG